MKRKLPSNICTIYFSHAHHTHIHLMSCFCLCFIDQNCPADPNVVFRCTKLFPIGPELSSTAQPVCWQQNTRLQNLDRKENLSDEYFQIRPKPGLKPRVYFSVFDIAWNVPLAPDCEWFYNSAFVTVATWTPLEAQQCLQVSLTMRFMIIRIMNTSLFVILGPQRKRGASGQIKKPPVEATAWCYTGTRYGWI